MSKIELTNQLRGEKYGEDKKENEIEQEQCEDSRSQNIEGPQGRPHWTFGSEAERANDHQNVSRVPSGRFEPK